MNDRSALTDEFKLGKDNSGPIKIHPELNYVSSLRPCVRDRKILAASTRMHLQKKLDYWYDSSSHPVLSYDREN